MAGPGSIAPREDRILRPDPGGLLRLNDQPDWARRMQGRNISYAVHLSDLAGEALFFAGTPQYLRIESTVIRRPFGNYQCRRPAILEPSRIRSTAGWTPRCPTALRTRAMCVPYP